MFWVLKRTVSTETVLLRTHNICFGWEIKENQLRTLIWGPDSLRNEHELGNSKRKCAFTICVFSSRYRGLSLRSVILSFPVHTHLIFDTTTLVFVHNTLHGYREKFSAYLYMHLMPLLYINDSQDLQLTAINALTFSIGVIRGALGWSKICDSVISWSYSLILCTLRPLFLWCVTTVNKTSFLLHA